MFQDKIYNEAKKRGYINQLAISAPDIWEMTLIGTWVLKYKNDLKTLSILEEVTHKQIVNWEDLTERTLKKFRDKVLSIMSANSAKQTFSKLKSVITDMKEEVEIPCKRYADILKCKSEPTQSVYLTEEEVTKLEEITPHGEYETYVKCIYIMECLCGARHSDILQLSNKNIKEVRDEQGNVTHRYISYISQKTSIEANIPLHRNFLKYLNGYNREIKMCDSTFNRILRNLCQRAGINEHTRLFRRGRWEEGEKWQFVSTHVGRKSFCSDLFMRGVDSQTIAKMAGHADSSITERTYIVPMRELDHKAMSFFN